MASVVVLVDDESLLACLRRDLDLAGHEVAGFSDWAAMLNLLDTGFACDAFLVELGRPPGTPNGHALGQMARTRRPRLQVVYIDAAPTSSNVDDLVAGIVVRSRRPSDIVAAVCKTAVLEARPPQLAAALLKPTEPEHRL